MSSSSASVRLWRAHELLGALPVAVWAGFHLFEQWSAFGGRDAFVARSSGTSHGPLALAVELALAISPALAWIVLDVGLRARQPEPPALVHAMAEDVETARRIGLLVRVASWLFFAWLVYHAAWLWLPKLVEGSDPVRAWERLRIGMGSWPHATLHAIGLSAFFVHLAAAVPRLFISLDWAETVENRRTARLCGGLIAALFLVLYAQLAGWHASATGTVWPLDS